VRRVGFRPARGALEDLLLVTDSHHGNEVVENAAVLGFGRGRDNFLGEGRDVVAELGSQEDMRLELETQACTEDAHRL
jgi:hypothetical protein